ncbi:MAG: zinc-binding dehydrogenase [Bacteroidota bacterium]
MKSLVVSEPGKATWTDIPEPELQAGEVLVTVEGVTTCPHWDLHVVSGEPMFADRPFSYPYIPGEPGHEMVGRVMRVASDVETLDAGQRVAAWRDPGGRRQGCYAERVPVLADHLLAIPDDLPVAGIASLELAMCVQGSFDDVLRVAPLDGKRVVIGGLGPAGLIAVQLAQAYGATQVVGVDPLPQRRAIAEALGCVAVPPGAPQLAADRLSEEAFDAGIDTTGLKVSIEALMTCVRGPLSIFGVLRETIAFGPNQWWGGFALMGYGTHTKAQAHRALDHITAGHLDLRPLVSTTLPMSAYLAGVDLLRQKEAVKVLFTVG